MAKGFRFIYLAFGFSKAENLSGSVHRLIRCKQVFTRVRGADVSFRDVTIRIPDRRYDQGRE